jgi:hypothetical protein
MTWVEVVVVAQLVVSLYLAYRVGSLQDEVDDTQMVLGSVLMERANEKTP